MYIPKLLKLLLAPFMLYADEEGGGAVVDRGDTLEPPEAEKTGDEAAKKDADDEIARIEAEKAEKEGKGDKTEAKDGDAEEEEEEADDAAAAKKKDSRIPVKRHTELLNKERDKSAALQAQLDQLQQGAKVADVNEVLAEAETKLAGLEEAYTKLMIDGDVEKATAKMREIRALERDIGEKKSDMKVAAAEARAVERVRYDTVVDRLLEAYPVLNHDHDDHDADTLQDVLDLKAVYQRRGDTASSALQKAAAKLLGAETKKQETATTVTPKVDAAAATAAARKEAATKLAIDANKKTPATAAKVGLDSDKLGGGLSAKNAMNMNQDEFAKLDEKQLAEMRGDTL